jgi:hypothetical protein
MEAKELVVHEERRSIIVSEFLRGIWHRQGRFFDVAHGHH